MRFFHEAMQSLVYCIPGMKNVWEIMWLSLEHLISWNLHYWEKSRKHFLPPILVACALHSILSLTNTHTHPYSIQIDTHSAQTSRLQFNTVCKGKTIINNTFFWITNALSQLYSMAYSLLVVGVAHPFWCTRSLTALAYENLHELRWISRQN